MKAALRGGFLVIIGFLVVLIISSIHAKNVRAGEVEESLSAAMESALTQIAQDEDYISVTNSSSESVKQKKDQELKDLFLKYLLAQIKTDSSVDVNFYTADYNHGILDVEVTETFYYQNKRKGSVSARKKAILEEYMKEKKGKTD